MPSLNSLNSDPIGAIDLNSFPMARTLPGLGDGQRNCPKSPILAGVINVQSIDTKWHLRATFYETLSLFWFSLFLLPLSRFLPFSFIPPRASLGGGVKYKNLSSKTKFKIYLVYQTERFFYQEYKQNIFLSISSDLDQPLMDEQHRMKCSLSTRERRLAIQ